MAIEFEDLDLDLDDESDGEEEAAKPPKVTLEELAARPGQAGDLARELLEIRKEREAKAEAARLAAQAEATLIDGEPDWSDPTFLDGLRARVVADQATASQAHLSGVRKSLERELFHPDTIAQRMSDVARDAAAVDEMLGGSDPLFDHPAYRAHRQRQFELQRGAQAGRSGWDGFLAEVGEAEAYVAAAKARARAEAEA